MNILRVKNPKTKLQKIRKKWTINSLYTNEILQKKLNWKRGKTNIKAEKNIQKIFALKEDSKSLKTKSADEKRKSENETCTILKKTK